MPSNDAASGRSRDRRVQVGLHEVEGFVPVAGGDGFDEAGVLVPTFVQVPVAVLASLVRQAFVAPAAADDRTHGQVSAKLRNDEVEGLVEPTGRRLPSFGFAGFCILYQQLQVGKNLVGNFSSAGACRLRLKQLSHLVEVYEPVLRAGAYGRPLIE